MPTRFIMLDVIKKIERRAAKRWVSGTGDKAVFEEDSQGWWAVLESSPVGMYLGEGDPGLAAGDQVRLILEKVQQ